jgi:hypothetical protein
MLDLSKTTSPAATPDFEAIKQRQQATWSAGDYAVVGTTLQIVGERLCEAVDLRAGLAKTVVRVAEPSAKDADRKARRDARRRSNVTADKETGLGNWTGERIIAAFQTETAATTASRPRSLFMNLVFRCNDK